MTRFLSTPIFKQLLGKKRLFWPKSRPSIRARARLALSFAFLVSLLALFIGVLSTDNVLNHAQAMIKLDDYKKNVLETRIALKDVDNAVWAFIAEMEFDSGQSMLLSIESLKYWIVKLVKEKPEIVKLGPPNFLEGLTARLEATINLALNNQNSLATARLGILSLSKELQVIENNVASLAEIERKRALGVLSTAGRDQLLLFLFLFFLTPIFVALVSGWIMRPLSSLRQLVRKVEIGKLKEIGVIGRDEIAALARALKTAFLQKEELEQKKSSKIFEIRNILRSVLTRINEPIFIIDEEARINYTNDSAAQLIGMSAHMLEGKNIADCIYSPALKKSIENALEGDITDDPISLQIEMLNGRIYDLKAKIGLVRNRNGEISRVVIVLVGE